MKNDSWKKWFKKEPLDKDADGKLLFKDDIVADIMGDLERRRSERRPLEAQWMLNANFLIGNQYMDINPDSGKIEQNLTSSVYSWQEHECFNRIAPLYSTRLAYLKKLQFIMSVLPRTNELEDIAKAEVSTAILKNFQSTSNFEAKKDSFMAWAEVTGTAFWLSWWDRYAGEKYAEVVKEIPTEDGVEVSRDIIYEGNVDYGMLSPYEVFPESIYKQRIEDQRSIIIEQVMTVEDIYDRFGIEVDGQKITTFNITPKPANGGYGYKATISTINTQEVENACKLVTYMERPGRRHPEGVLAMIVNGQHLVHYGGMPYDDIPLQKYTSFEVAGQFFGKSFIEDEIPLQRAYNNLVNMIHSYARRVAVTSYAVEEGSIINIEDYQDEGLEPGGFLIYQHGSNVPIPINVPNFPAHLFNERAQLENHMMYVACLSILQAEGSTPSGVTSGAAINTLQSNDNTRLALQGGYLRECVRHLAKTWLSIFKRYASLYRAVQYVGANEVGSAIIWSREDISDYDVAFDTQNELEVSEAEQRQRFLEAYNNGAYTDASGRIPQKIKNKMVSLTGDYYKSLMSVNERQVQRAERENALFSERLIIPRIRDVDDDDIHLEYHTSFALETKFDLLMDSNPNACEMFEQHIKMHEERLNQKRAEMAQQMMTR